MYILHHVSPFPGAKQCFVGKMVVFPGFDGVHVLVRIKSSDQRPDRVFAVRQTDGVDDHNVQATHRMRCPCVGEDVDFAEKGFQECRLGLYIAVCPGRLQSLVHNGISGDQTQVY